MNRRRREVTGYRNPLLSQLHHNMGDECTVQDLDFVEYLRGRTPEPLALIETKFDNLTKLENHQKQVLLNLAAPRSYELPVFVYSYNGIGTRFRVEALNDPALSILNRTFKERRRENLYFYHEDGSVEMNFPCLMSLTKAIHRIDPSKSVSGLDPDDILAIQEHTIDVNPEQPLDENYLRDLLK